MSHSSHLDAVNDSPMATGPSRDWKAITKDEPRWREESFQIQPKRLPVSIKMKPSVIAHMPRQPDMAISRVPVLVRSSNQRPVEAGNGPQGSAWQLSDPDVQPSGAMPGMGGLQPAGMGTGPSLGLTPGVVLGLGALAGCLLFYVTNRR